MAGFKDKHQAFIDKTNAIDKQAKELVFKYVMDAIDINGLLKEPEAEMKKAKKEFLRRFAPFFKKAVDEGQRFGKEKVAHGNQD